MMIINILNWLYYSAMDKISYNVLF